MRRRRNNGLGQYAGNPDPPQQLGAGVRAGLFMPTLTGGPGLRVARSRAAYGSKTWTGTGLTLQGFVRQAAGVNSPEALDVSVAAPLKRNRSRSLGQMRGFPYMANTGGVPGA